VTWGQNVCRPVYPLCPQCVLVDLCPKIGVKKVGKPAADHAERQPRTTRITRNAKV
jgi:hypothetical protein